MLNTEASSEGVLQEKETPTQVFAYEFCKIFKNIYFVEHLRKDAPNTTTFQKLISRIYLSEIKDFCLYTFY